MHNYKCIWMTGYSAKWRWWRAASLNRRSRPHEIAQGHGAGMALLVAGADGAPSRSVRRGLTLIELLVVFAIVAIMVGLLAAAIQRVRDAAARAQCSNNLKQIVLGAHHYHDTKKRFPAGVHSGKGHDPYRMATWLTFLLPHLEQQPLWRSTEDAYRQTRTFTQNPPHIGLATVVPVFSCPADGRVDQVQIAQRERIPIALTSYLGVEGRDLKTLDGVLFRDSQIRIADIVDGTGNTLFAGERPPSPDYQYGWWYAGIGQRYTGSADSVLGVCEWNILRVSKGTCAPGTYQFGPGSMSNPCDMFHFWSPHAGNGATFAFADGTVRFLQYSAAPIMPALASRAGQETVAIID
jgi:prepilin-type N-terminal cleavage/methylation domain-containing protein